MNGVNGQGARCINMHNWSISTVYPVWIWVIAMFSTPTCWDAHESSLSPRTILTGSYWCLVENRGIGMRSFHIIPYHSHLFSIFSTSKYICLFVIPQYIVYQLTNVEWLKKRCFVAGNGRILYVQLTPHYLIYHISQY